MCCQEVDPLPEAFDRDRCPALLGMMQPPALLPVRALEGIGERNGVEGNLLHLGPFDRSPLDGSIQALGFSLVHLRPLSRERKSEETIIFVQRLCC